MKRLLLALLFLAIPATGWAQIDKLVVGANPVQGGSEGQCLTISGQRLSSGACGGTGTGNVSTAGTLTSANVIVGAGTTNVSDSGVVLLTQLPATSVWGNCSTSTGVPAALTQICLPNGTAGAPSYSFGNDLTSGLSLSTTGQPAMYAGGKIIAKFTTPSATNSLQFSAGSVPSVISVGTNTALQLSGAGTAGVDLMTNSTNARIFSTVGIGTVVNYLKTTATASGTGTVKIEAIGGDSNIDLQFGPAGTGVIQPLNAGSFAANGSVATTMTSLGPTGSHTTIQEWWMVKNAAGTVRYIPLY